MSNHNKFQWSTNEIKYLHISQYKILLCYLDFLFGIIEFFNYLWNRLWKKIENVNIICDILHWYVTISFLHRKLKKFKPNFFILILRDKNFILSILLSSKSTFFVEISKKKFLTKTFSILEVNICPKCLSNGHIFFLVI